MPCATETSTNCIQICCLVTFTLVLIEGLRYLYIIKPILHLFIVVSAGVTVLAYHCSKFQVFLQNKILRSLSSFSLPNNTTVCTFTSIQLRRAGQQGPTRTLAAGQLSATWATKQTTRTSFAPATTKNPPKSIIPHDIQSTVHMVHGTHGAP